MSGAVWVTGGAGMVGSWVIQSLRAAGTADSIHAPTSAELDLRDVEAVRDFVRCARPDLVVHAAGRVGGISANIQAPVAFLSDNMLIGMNVIGESARAGVPQLVNIGSSCMYPKGRELLHEEDILTGLLEPTNEGYALAKIAADRLCEYVSRERALVFRTIIPSNLYGPRDHFDERGHLLASAIRKVHEAHQSGGRVQVWGDGTARREFTYVADLSDWLVEVLPRLDELPQRLNVGSGVDHTVREFYELASEVVGYHGSYDFETDRPTGMARKLMDSSRAQAFGWKADTSLSVGVQRTYEYFLQTNEAT